ncbi:50S ribosomal protein L6 [Gammaproteobacteria bacterium]|nr:50S ribosomal protein L6 [Gammaproteobacteria bacterium]
MLITSRVARQPIEIPSNVNVDIKGEQITLKGPKGTISVNLNKNIEIFYSDNKIEIKNSTKKIYSRSGSGDKIKKSIPGTMRSLINNAVHGVSVGFERKLNLVGVGYRAQMKGKVLNLALGFSHPVEFTPPEGVVIEAPNLTEILIKGADKHLVGHTTAKIIAKRPQEPYKGKGIVNPEKPVVRKETKKK